MRLATMDDLDTCVEIINDAKAFLKLNGSLQWQQGYPRRENLIKDIETKTLYLYEEYGTIKGMMALKQEFTKNYTGIFDGNWEYPPSDEDLIVHRIAVKAQYRGQGIGNKMIEFALEYAKKNNIHHLKTDTHKNNIPMQKVAEHAGFQRKGTVISMLEEKDHFRIAYELNI